MQLYRNCIRKLGNLWMQWKDINKQNTRKDDKRRKGFSRKIDSLWDIAAERAVHQTISISLLSKKEKKKTLNYIKISVRDERER